MIGQIAKTSDFDKNLIVNSNTKNYNSNYSESSIKNINYEFGDIFSDLTTISNYRTGNLNFIALSGKENADEVNGIIINLQFPENLKKINSIKLIVAINDFEIYTSNISDSIFFQNEIEPNFQSDGNMEKSVDGYSSGVHILSSGQDYIKNYTNYEISIKVTSTNANATGELQTPSNFRTFSINNIKWRNPDEEYYEQQNLKNHTHEFKYLANLLDSIDHNHPFISDNHSHNYSIPNHIHFADKDHTHKIKFFNHYHNIKTSHTHQIIGEDLFYKNFGATNINIKEINKNYNINGNTEIDLTNDKSNFTNKITLIPNAKSNLTYFILIEIYCLDDE